MVIVFFNLGWEVVVVNRIVFWMFFELGFFLGGNDYKFVERI